MKVLVISDSHGAYSKMYTLFKSDNYRAVIFLGDGIHDADRLYDISGSVPIYKVAGNCDTLMPMAFHDQLLELGGKRIFITHGHNYFVKKSVHRLYEKALEHSADIALFGHTHIPFYENKGGILLANPGSLMQGKFAVMTIENGTISFKHGDFYDEN